MGPSEQGMGKTSVPALLRQQVDRWAGAWLTAKFSRILELRAQDPGPFNYPIAVFSVGFQKEGTLDFQNLSPLTCSSPERG
jgi:hypothetical protein